MKKRALIQPCLLLALALALVSAPCFAAPPQSAQKELKIGFVNFRRAVEESKVGKREQTSFEALQNQMESSLMEIQKQLSEVTTKLSDEDYLDGLSPDAENELKHKYRTLNQELGMTQNQYVQALQQANLKILQSLQNEVVEAAKQVAQSKGLQLVVNEEAAFYHDPSLDVTEQVIAIMNQKEESNKGSSTKQK